MSARNRQKGHEYEREIRLNLIGLGFNECMTSRYASTYYDDIKVDLVNTGFFNIQCKNSIHRVAYHKVLESMPDDVRYNVVFHKLRGKQQYCMLSFEDFKELLGMLSAEGVSLQNNKVLTIESSRNVNYVEIFKDKVFKGSNNGAILHKKGDAKYIIIKKETFFTIVDILVKKKVINTDEPWSISAPRTPDQEDIE